MNRDELKNLVVGLLTLASIAFLGFAIYSSALHLLFDN